ncbi:MAG: DUF3887 domain-containing protein [Candidatus Dormibacteria bacterium]
MGEKSASHQGSTPDEEVLAELLARNAEVAVAALRHGGRRDRSGHSRLAALAVGRTLEEVATDVLRAFVSGARAAGHTWQEIGDVLRVSRQAAQQRFGDGAREGATVDGNEDVVLGARALSVVERWRRGELGELRAEFDDLLSEALTEQRLADAWAQVEVMVGSLTATGRPTLTRRGPHLVVDVPLAFDRGPMKARVTFDSQARVSGLFVLYPDVP